MGRKRTASDDQGEAYERRKEGERVRQAVMSRTGRDIGDLPAVADLARKSACRADFRRFCDSYLPHTFTMPWSPDHLKAIDRIQQSVLQGGLFAFAMPRGSGKTSLCEAGCLWAVLYGHRQFVCLIGASEPHAAEMLDSIKTEIESNDRLEEDFPEVCYPVLRLEGIHNRCKGQLQNGERTQITWTDKEVVLPTIQGSAASGAIVKVAGITGRIRGMKFKRPDGRSARPDLVVIDDPQTDESAHSPSQCVTREGILAGAILGLAGPGTRIAGVMPCTVVRPGDMADRILDRSKHPEWQGERTKLVYRWPDREDLWQRYAELRADGFRAGDDGAAANEFYAANRAPMDAGAEVAWPERFDPGELSAIQHAWNTRLRVGESAFQAEYQNDPLPPRVDAVTILDADQIAGKLNRLARGAVPTAALRVTAGIDVQGDLLYWLVAAWGEDFTGWVIDYGSYPDQRRPYFTLRDARDTLGLRHPGGLEASIYAGLEALAADILGRGWKRDDGADLHVERCLVDANWGSSTEVVYQWCRQSRFPTVVVPSHGKFVGASGRPMSEWQRQPGDRVGTAWRIPALAKGKAVRHCLFDSNFWKSFTHERLAVPLGTPGNLSLFGDSAARHRLLADHLTAEYPVRVSGRGRTVDEWKARPERMDNHWLDCLVLAAVAASVQGCGLPEMPAAQPTRRPRVSFAEMQARRRQAR